MAFTKLSERNLYMTNEMNAVEQFSQSCSFWDEQVCVIWKKACECMF